MKKTIIAFLLISLVFLTGCAGGTNQTSDKPTPSIVPKSESAEIPEGSASFTVINSSGGDIYEMYVSAAMEDSFGSDILADRIIKANDKMTVYTMPAEGVEYYDLKVLREDGEYYTWLNVPIGKFSDIDIKLGDNGPEFTIK